MKNYILLLFSIISIYTYAQVGIGTNSPEEGSILELKGRGAFLLPRVSLISPTSKLPIIPATSTNTPIEGMMVYNINGNLTEMPDGIGIYYWDGLIWTKLDTAGGGINSSLWYKTGTTSLATTTTEKITRDAEVTLGNNVDREGAILNLESDDQGLLLNRVTLVSLTSTEPLIIPSNPASLSEGMLVYHVGSANISEGLYYWGGTHWNVIYSGNTVKPLNALYNDGDTYPADNSNATPSLVLNTAPNLNLLQCEYTGAGDFSIINNPIPSFNFLSDTRGPHILNSENGSVLVNNTSTDGLMDLVNIPAEALDNAITINLSLKYEQSSSNSESARIVAYGSADGITYNVKIKDAFYRLSKTASAFTFVRDELSLTNIIVTQNMVDYGLRIYIGNANTGNMEFFEPAITLNYGTVTY